jgi:hypothetical protein
VKKLCPIRQSKNIKACIGDTMMKIICFLFFAIMLFSPVSQVQGAEWLSIGKDRAGNEVFFDLETMTKRSGILKAWMKGIYSDEGRKERIQDRVISKASVERYETLGYALELQEIDCIKREFRVMAYTDYSSDGRILHTTAIEQQPSEGWEPIAPESMGEIVAKIACPSQSSQPTSIKKGKGFIHINGNALVQVMGSQI